MLENQVSERRPRVVRATVSEMGRSRIVFDCPFCGVEVTAFEWSLAARGKRCACGALHGRTETEAPGSPPKLPRKAKTRLETVRGR